MGRVPLRGRKPTAWSYAHPGCAAMVSRAPAGRSPRVVSGLSEVTAITGLRMISTVRGPGTDLARQVQPGAGRAANGTGRQTGDSPELPISAAAEAVMASKGERHPGDGPASG